MNNYAGSADTVSSTSETASESPKESQTASMASKTSGEHL